MDNKPTLDLKDRKILYELDLNARETDTKIAKKVGLSRDVVRYRINRMINEGYINYFMTILNTMKIGYYWYRTFFKFQNVNLKKEKEIINWLKDRASWITKVEGSWDLNTGIFCKNVYEYRDIINEFLIRYGKYVDNYSVAIVTRMWHYQKNYLLEDKQKLNEEKIMSFSEDAPIIFEKIDKIDYNILNYLLKNARAKTTEIAEMLNLTEIMVRYRIKNLIKKGIIIGFKPFLNISKLGYIYYKVHFNLKNINQNKKRDIFSFMHHHPATVHTTELVGGDDLEVEFQVKSNEELYKYIQEIRNKFPKNIKEYKFMQYTEEYKFSYLP